MKRLLQLWKKTGLRMSARSRGILLEVLPKDDKDKDALFSLGYLIILTGCIFIMAIWLWNAAFGSWSLLVGVGPGVSWWIFVSVACVLLLIPFEILHLLFDDPGQPAQSYGDEIGVHYEPPGEFIENIGKLFSWCGVLSLCLVALFLIFTLQFPVGFKGSGVSWMLIWGELLVILGASCGTVLRSLLIGPLVSLRGRLTIRATA